MKKRVFQDLNLFQIPDGFRGRGPATVQIWWIVQALLFSTSPQVLYGWRRFLLRTFGAKIGKGVIIRPSVRITYPWKLSIGDNCQIGDRVELYTLGEIKIGANSVISQDCYICAGGHDPARPDFAIYQAPISIEDQVWLAAGCFVMPGVTIGKGTVAMVRSLIANNTLEGAVVAGTPARQTKTRDALLPLDIADTGQLQRPRRS